MARCNECGPIIEAPVHMVAPGAGPFAGHERYAEGVPTLTKPRLRAELAIVLALSYGASGVYSIVTIIDRVTREAALSTQTATINRALSDRPLFDLIYQVLGVAFGLAPVALVMWLLWQHRAPHLGALGLGRSTTQSRRWWISETLWGFVLAAAIGVPGIALYLGAKTAGLNTTVVPTALGDYWWTIPVLLLSALRAALGEELIVVAYLFERLRRLGVGPIAVVLTSALLRGSYHLYQGFGGFIGNVAMGLVFGWVYHRTGRALPLIVAHVLLDVVSFVGYPLAVAWWPELFGLTT